MEDHFEALKGLPFVKGIESPYNEYLEGQITPDGTSGLARVRVEGSASSFTDAQRAELTAAAKALEENLPGSVVNIGGEVFSIHIPTLTAIEALGLAIAVVVLIVTLGSVVAAMMPIATAITGVVLGVAVVMIAAGIIPISSTTLILAIMLGLAVGIDYALFILSRHRDQLATGMDPEESAARAIGTAGLGGGLRRSDRDRSRWSG